MVKDVFSIGYNGKNCFSTAKLIIILQFLFYKKKFTFFFPVIP